jgi:repressor LexA
MVDKEEKDKVTVVKDEPKQTIRPTKRQLETLSFISEFITKHGYSPSYREIMSGCNHTSVATVALHVNNLIKRGHLKKRNRSARSLEIVGVEINAGIPINRINETEEKWLIGRVEQFFIQAEQSTPSEKQIDELYVLIGFIKILGLEGAAYSYIRRLNEIKKRPSNKFTV